MHNSVTLKKPIFSELHSLSSIFSKKHACSTIWDNSYRLWTTNTLPHSLTTHILQPWTAWDFIIGRYHCVSWSQFVSIRHIHTGFLLSWSRTSRSFPDIHSLHPKSAKIRRPSFNYPCFPESCFSYSGQSPYGDNLFYHYL